VKIELEFEDAFVERLEAAIPGEKPLAERVEESIRRHVGQTELNEFRSKLEDEAKKATAAKIAVMAQELTDELKL